MYHTFLMNFVANLWQSDNMNMRVLGIVVSYMTMQHV